MEEAWELRGSQTTNRTRKRSRARVEAKSDELDGWSLQSQQGTRKVLSGMDERAANGSPGRGLDTGGLGDEEDE